MRLVASSSSLSWPNVRLRKLICPWNCSAVTLQHLPAVNSLTPAISSTSTVTTATKFVSARLFSKKRAVAVLDAGNPQPRRGELEGESRKRKKGAGKGMSAESKALLGMGMDDGSKKTSEDEQRRERKRTLLNQAEGKRKAGESPSQIVRSRASSSARSLGRGPCTPPRIYKDFFRSYPCPTSGISESYGKTGAELRNRHPNPMIRHAALLVPTVTTSSSHSLFVLVSFTSLRMIQVLSGLSGGAVPGPRRPTRPRLPLSLTR